MTLAARLQAAVRDAEVLDAARALIRAPSVTGDEGPAVEAARGWLAARGLGSSVIERAAGQPLAEFMAEWEKTHPQHPRGRDAT